MASIMIRNLVSRSFQTISHARHNMRKLPIPSLSCLLSIQKIAIKSPSIPVLGLTGLTVHARMSDDKKKKATLVKADELFTAGNFTELLRLLVEQESWYDDCEILWRVARCKYHLSKNEKDSGKSTESLRDSLVNVERALELNSQCGPAHKWAAILIDAVSASQGRRARIEQTLNVKHHMEQAIKLMPNDGTSWYLLGEWHYSLATTGWTSRQIAAVIFAKLPEASLEEALNHFNKAEDVEPGFYSKNLVMKAKTLIALDRDKDQAKESLLQVIRQYATSSKWDDKEAVVEAKALLHKLGVKL